MNEREEDQSYRVISYIKGIESERASQPYDRSVVESELLYCFSKRLVYCDNGWVGAVITEWNCFE